MLGASKGNSQFSGNRVIPQPVEKTEKGNGSDFITPPSKKSDTPDPSCTSEFNQMMDIKTEFNTKANFDFFDEFILGDYHILDYRSYIFSPLLTLLFTIKKDVNDFYKWDKSGSRSANLRRITEEEIKEARKTLRQFRSRCYRSLDVKDQIKLEEIEGWLEEQQSNLNEFSNSRSNASLAKPTAIRSQSQNTKTSLSKRAASKKPSAIGAKKPTDRGLEGSMSDAVLNYANFSVNLPDNLIRNFNSWVTPKPKKQTPAQFKAQVLQDQKAEIDKRKTEAADIEAQKNPVANFMYAIPRFLPLLRYVVP